MSRPLNLMTVTSGFALLFAASHAGAIEITADTNQAQYCPGENLVVLVTAHNPSDQPVTLTFGSSLQALYTMDGIYTPSNVALPVITHAQIPANGTRSWALRHVWTSYPLPVGAHSVIGKVLTWLPPDMSPESEPIQFTVVPGIPAPRELLLDFEAFPGTSYPVRGAWDYEPYGVKFESLIGDYPVLEKDASGGGNTYLDGKSFRASFDMPVYRASFRLSGPAGTQVSITALDESGNVLVSELSATLDGLGQFGQPMTIESSQAIASLEWRSSQISDHLAIDDLIVPEPRALFGLSLLMLLAGSNRSGARVRAGTRTMAKRER